MKVTVSVGGTWNAFRLAEQLDRRGLLRRLTTHRPRRGKQIRADRLVVNPLRGVLMRAPRLLGFGWRPGYTHDEMRADHFGGAIRYALTGATRRLSAIHARGARAALFPLRAFQVMDPPLTRLLRAPFMSIGVVALKPE